MERLIFMWVGSLPWLHSWPIGHHNRPAKCCSTDRNGSRWQHGKSPQILECMHFGGFVPEMKGLIYILPNWVSGIVVHLQESVWTIQCIDGIRKHRQTFTVPYRIYTINKESNARWFEGAGRFSGVLCCYIRSEAFRYFNPHTGMVLCGVKITATYGEW